MPRNANHTSHTGQFAFRAKSVVIVGGGGGGGGGEEGLTFVLVNECKLLFGSFPSSAKNNRRLLSLQHVQFRKSKLEKTDCSSVEQFSAHS